VVILSTGRLLLRHFEPGGLGALQALYAEPEMNASSVTIWGRATCTRWRWMADGAAPVPSGRRRDRPPMRHIDAGSLRLEPQCAAHADEMFRVLSDPAIYEFENEAPPSAEWVRERFTKLESRSSPDGREQWLNWVIRLPPQQLIGFVQATVHADGCCDIAYELGSAWWGAGHASRAVQAMIDELASQYGVRELRAVLVQRNHRSMRLLGRLGFKPAAAAVGLEPGEIRMRRKLQER
jgi:[ribosomal protein S5]-alanine N-acetyltransferase